ncbi:hypothetical protein [Streptomyces atriruber]|uniref:hypothetical protein n=1 Tax=Streptomyces atriruber TaxID=545121 RepID=UPI0006E2FF7F|nr:hypothetical protein [Streptomyces atriruber]
MIGSAGGPAKAKKLLDTFGYAAAIDHREGALSEQLAQAAIGAIRPGGRIALVGAVSTYDSPTPPPGPDSLFRAAKQGATLRGMLVTSHLDLFPEWTGRAAPLLADGIERAPEAFLGVLRGANTGKMLVRIAADAAPTGTTAPTGTSFTE